MDKAVKKAIDAIDQDWCTIEGLPAEVVLAHEWADGIRASLRAGLAAVGRQGAVLVSLVDLPDVGPDVVARVLAADAGLARAAYDGRPGHPVLLGASHLDPVMATLHGDRGRAPTSTRTTSRWSSAGTWPPGSTSTVGEANPALTCGVVV